MALDKAKLEEYANILYEGDLKRFNEKQKKDDSLTFGLSLTQESKGTKGKRIPPSSSQGKVVIETHKQCVICGEKYEDSDNFDIHHLDGDRSYTVTTNLVLLCLRCHKKVHKHARSKLSDYKVKNKNASSKNQSSFDAPLIGSVTFKSSSSNSPFLGPLKKKN